MGLIRFLGLKQLSLNLPDLSTHFFIHYLAHLKFREFGTGHKIEFFWYFFNQIQSTLTKKNEFFLMGDTRENLWNNDQQI